MIAIFIKLVFALSDFSNLVQHSLVLKATECSRIRRGNIWCDLFFVGVSMIEHVNVVEVYVRQVYKKRSIKSCWLLTDFDGKAFWKIEFFAKQNVGR